MSINLPAPWKPIKLTLSLGGGCTLFIVKELEEPVLSMRSKKASGSDGNRSEMLKYKPDLLVGVLLPLEGCEDCDDKQRQRRT